MDIYHDQWEEVGQEEEDDVVTKKIFFSRVFFMGEIMEYAEYQKIWSYW